MVLTDKYTNQQILGCLMKKPLLMVDHDIRVEDFGAQKVAKIIFISIKNLFEKGASTISPIEIDQDIERYEASNVIYKQERGLDVLKDSFDLAEENNFKYYYTRMKKLTLLRVLLKQGYDVSPYYKKDFESLEEENETLERFDGATVEDILNYVEGNYNRIKQEFLTGKKEDAQAANGIEELIDGLMEKPEIGVPLCGEMLSTITSGARLGKYYLRAASSGSGKTRTMVFDACKICFPVYWSHTSNAFVREVDDNEQTRPARKTLIITTELAKDEIQTMVLSYLSGVNETHLLMSNFLPGEIERIRFAAKIMKKYQDCLFIDAVPDPNLTNIQSIIKKYATLDKVKYVFYDYIYTSPSLINQFSGSRIREDVALMMLSTQLKDLATEYNLFISSATQVNAEAMNGEGFKNETCVRGAKSIVD